jgi:hypothetical protein
VVIEDFAEFIDLPTFIAPPDPQPYQLLLLRVTEDKLGKAYWAAWDCSGDPAGSGHCWEDLPEEGRVRFRRLAMDMLRRVGNT